MTSDLHSRVRATVERHGMLAAGDTVGVGVSGGADSVALLWLLHELRAELGVVLRVLHFNHCLRGPDSDADETFVADLAASLGLEFETQRRDVAAFARDARSNLEEAARHLRYSFFDAVVQAGRVKRVAVAHTADDQAETVLAHILRGTGLAGLAGIHPVAGAVVRPLLEVRREELREFLTAGRKTWREDASNRDESRLRARIRHTLLPQLEKNFQPAAVERLSSLAGLARQEEHFWQALTEHVCARQVQESESVAAIAIRDFLNPLPLAGQPAPEALLGRVVRHMVAGVKGHKRQLSAAHVEQVVRLARQGTGGQRAELPGLVVERTLDRRLVFRLPAGTPARAETYEYEVELPEAGSTDVDVAEIGKRFHLKVIDWSAGAGDTRVGEPVLDRDLLEAPLVIRNWRPGDAYRPMGRRKAHKLKRLLAESRIEARERAGWPVMTSAGRVVWARGFPPAEQFVPARRTRRGLVICEDE